MVGKDRAGKRLDLAERYRLPAKGMPSLSRGLDSAAHRDVPHPATRAGVGGSLKSRMISMRPYVQGMGIITV